MKLHAKIMCFGVLPVFVVLLLVTALVLGSLYRNLQRVGETQIRQELREAALRLEWANTRAVLVPRVMALAQENGLFGNRPDSVALARGVLEAFPEFTGAYFGYEPDADRRDAAALGAVDVDPQALDTGGRFLPYWFRDLEDASRIQLTPLVDMEKSYYYRGMKNRATGRPEAEGIELEGGVSSLYRAGAPDDTSEMRTMVTEPYVYEGKFIVEQTSPIIIDGEFVGIAGVDRALNDLDDFLRSLRSHESADFILVSRRGRIISATMNAELRAQKIEDTPFADLARPLYLGEEDETMALVEDPVSGEVRYFAGYRVPTGYWSLLLAVSQEEILRPVWSTLRNALLVLVLGGSGALLISFLFVRSLAGRVERAAAAAEQVAGGDLTLEIESNATDETGQLLRAIGGMVQSLGGLVGQMKRSSVQLVSTATEIGAASRQQEEMTANFGASTGQIAASVKEISATSQELLRTMDDVTAATAATADVADQGRTGLGGMESMMRQLAEATGSISSKLAVMSERAKKISGVVTTITKVADQTNLLSLNAAIEAQKAGEYGLGFAVVAREIRRLADQTAVATLDIEKIVGEMQSSVSSGVMEMDRFSEEVHKCVTETTRLSEQFAQIIEGVKALNPQFQAVHQGMQAQAVGAEQISDAMLQLDEVARRSDGSSHNLHAAASQLRTAVEDLKSEVARFRVG